jgi:thymidylate synthase (FAD)
MKIRPMKIKVLDHGYVEFIESWGKGRDEHVIGTTLTGDVIDYEVGIVEAARQSTQGNFRGWETDQKLLAHLFNKKPPHAGPFEFAGMVIEIQAPIFVFREWHRHRTQSYNEMSARYAPLPEALCTPTLERLMMVNEKSKNKQEGNVGGIELSAENAQKWLELLESVYAQAMYAYRFGLEIGVAKEVARYPMPVGHYSRMRASANLRNWLAFLTLRMDPDAQWEIRQYAEAVADIIAEHFPRTYSLFYNARPTGL